MGQKVTQQQFDQAQKAVKRWQEQEAEKRQLEYQRDLAAKEALLAELGDNPRLIEWAEQKRLREIERGIGTKGDPERTRMWILQMLKLHVIEVSEAFGIPVETIITGDA